MAVFQLIERVTGMTRLQREINLFFFYSEFLHIME